jgi:DNA polymerase-3 subunit epsilon
LADRVGVPEVAGLSQAGELSYLELLDRVLEDRHVSDEEVRALAAIAQEWQLPAPAVRELHERYLRGVWALARADGVVTDAERRDLEILTDLLGVTVDDGTIDDLPKVSRSHSLAGQSVCFTGDSVCTMHGASLSRDQQEWLAAEAGLVVKTGVSGKLDILVLADPDSKSGKARKADELGIRKIAEPVFWRLLGVPID